VQVDVARLPEITQTLYDPSEHVQEEATREFRKLLSIERNRSSKSSTPASFRASSSSSPSGSARRGSSRLPVR
jgi:hypothetical protein